MIQTRKILSVLLTAAMTCSAFSAFAIGNVGAAEISGKAVSESFIIDVEDEFDFDFDDEQEDGIFTSGDYKYTLLEDGTAQLSEYTGSEENVEIPSELDGKTVTSVTYNVFWSCDNLKSVKIPDSVTDFDPNAFHECENLVNIETDSENKNYASVDGVLFNKDKTEIVKYPMGRKETSYSIPSGVTSVGGYAFEYSQNLESVTIPDGVTEIGEFSFAYCSSLKSVNIPNSVTEIKFVSFIDCSSLENVTLPQGLKSVGFWAFTNCTGIKSITIPKSVEEIGAYAIGYYWNFNEKDEIDMKAVPEFIISGYAGTAAENYAKENGIEFTALEDESVMGDVDLNGRLNINDATYLQRAIAEYFTLTAEQEILADMDGNGFININDVTAIQREIAEY